MARKKRTKVNFLALESSVHFGNGFCKTLRPFVDSIPEDINSTATFFAEGPRIFFLGQNLTYIAELGLKAVKLSEDPSVTNNHDLWKIFLSLSDKNRNILRSFLPVAEARLGRNFRHMTLRFSSTKLPEKDSLSFSDQAINYDLDLVLKHSSDQNHFFRYFFERFGVPVGNNPEIVFHYEALYYFCVVLFEDLKKSILKHKTEHEFTGGINVRPRTGTQPKKDWEPH